MSDGTARMVRGENEMTTAMILKLGSVVAVVSFVACGPASGVDDDSRPTTEGVLPAGDSVRHRSSDVLALLPEGNKKRKLLLDCTACHQLDVSRVFVDGDPRTEREWRESLERMREFGGVETATPLISPGRDAAATSAWLSSVLVHPPAPSTGITPPHGAEITAFPFPYASDLPHDVALEPDGTVLVTGMFTHEMMRLDPDDGSWTPFEIPVPEANPRAVEVDSIGDWWVLLGAPGKIARYRVDEGAWDTWDIGMYGHSLRLDGRGRVWFNGHFTRHPSVFGWLDIESGTVSTIDVPDEPPPEADHPMPYGLRVADDGTVWGTELRGGRLFAHDPGTGTTTVYAMPEPHSGPRRPAVDAAGRVWIPEYAGNRLTVFDPARVQFSSFRLPITDALPYVAEVDRRTGIVWIGTAAADAVLSFDPAEKKFTVYPMPHEGALVRHLVVDPTRGDVWAAYGAYPGIAPSIVRIRPAGSGPK